MPAPNTVASASHIVLHTKHVSSSHSRQVHLENGCRQDVAPPPTARMPSMACSMKQVVRTGDSAFGAASKMLTKLPQVFGRGRAHTMQLGCGMHDCWAQAGMAEGGRRAPPPGAARPSGGWRPLPAPGAQPAHQHISILGRLQQQQLPSREHLHRGGAGSRAAGRRHLPGCMRCARCACPAAHVCRCRHCTATASQLAVRHVRIQDEKHASSTASSTACSQAWHSKSPALCPPAAARAPACSRTYARCSRTRAASAAATASATSARWGARLLPAAAAVMLAATGVTGVEGAKVYTHHVQHGTGQQQGPI